MSERNDLIRDAISDDALDLGTTLYGSVVHLVDFETDSALASETEPDRTVCGNIGDYDRFDEQEEGEVAGQRSEFCYSCVKTAWARDRIERTKPFGFRPDQLHTSARTPMDGGEQ